MGWDVERFVNKTEVMEELMCSICTDVLENPVQTPCQHNFCNDCIKVWLDDGKLTCPVDRKRLTFKDLKPSRVLQQLLNTFVIRCIHFQDGCSLMAKFEDMPQLIEHEMNQCRVNQYEYFRDQHENNLKEIEDKEKIIEDQKERIESLEEELEEQHKTKNEHSEIERILVESQSTTITDLKEKLAEKETKIEELMKIVRNQKKIIEKQKELGEAIAAQAKSIADINIDDSIDDIATCQSSSASSNPFLSASTENTTTFDDIFWRDAIEENAESKTNSCTNANSHSEACRNDKGKKKKIPFHDPRLDEEDGFIRGNGYVGRSSIPPTTTIHFKRGSPSSRTSSSFSFSSPSSPSHSRHKSNRQTANRIVISEDDDERYEPNPCNQQ